ncbi:hypothetical protein T484DRAFT_3463457 [Baffinella frigidus]|nr:hypothetical protein T484DRAFT_3463457 [Cryptophyta sp. CCMP2293]
MLKLIKGDVLICTQCGATQMGPVTCDCPGGKRKPGADYCPKLLLIAAAKARGHAIKATELKDHVRKQGAVAGERAKNKLGQIDLNAELQGEGTEVTVAVQYPIGKLGLTLEKNCVSAVTGSPAEELGVKKGWILAEVAGDETPADKAAVAKMIMTVFKEQKTGEVTFRFRTPITDGFSCCTECNKYMEDSEFDGAMLTKGPGKQMCLSCEEFSGMF